MRDSTAGRRARGLDALHELLEAQAYRLAYWRVASDQINYRRFFDINDLAALRMEDEAVFEATHRLVLELLAEGRVDGLRIDHPDGLYDPARLFPPPAGALRPVGRLAQAERRWPLYLLAEKITAGHERMPGSWTVYGTTGYRFANVVNGLFVDTRREAENGPRLPRVRGAGAGFRRGRPPGEAPHHAHRARERARRSREPARRASRRPTGARAISP